MNHVIYDHYGHALTVLYLKNEVTAALLQRKYPSDARIRVIKYESGSLLIHSRSAGVFFQGAQVERGRPHCLGRKITVHEMPMDMKPDPGDRVSYSHDLRFDFITTQIPDYHYRPMVPLIQPHTAVATLDYGSHYSYINHVAIRLFCGDRAFLRQIAAGKSITDHMRRIIRESIYNS